MIRPLITVIRLATTWGVTAPHCAGLCRAPPLFTWPPTGPDPPFPRRMPSSHWSLKQSDPTALAIYGERRITAAFPHSADYLCRSLIHLPRVQVTGAQSRGQGELNGAAWSFLVFPPQEPWRCLPSSVWSSRRAPSLSVVHASHGGAVPRRHGRVLCCLLARDVPSSLFGKGPTGKA
jgi:hypothetical protein